MEWEEITQETRKNIVLALRNNEYMVTSRLAREVDRSKGAINKQINNLNDWSVVHHSGKGYHLIPDKVKFERATDKYVPEFLVFVPSILILTLSAFYYTFRGINMTNFALGFTLAFVFPFLKKVYDVATEREYTRVFRKKQKKLEDAV